MINLQYIMDCFFVGCASYCVTLIGWKIYKIIRSYFITLPGKKTLKKLALLEPDVRDRIMTEDGWSINKPSDEKIIYKKGESVLSITQVIGE